jgi:hypothetical protein
MPVAGNAAENKFKRVDCLGNVVAGAGRHQDRRQAACEGPALDDFEGCACFRHAHFRELAAVM